MAKPIAVLIDEHDGEYVYRFKTDQGTKYLFKIVERYNDCKDLVGHSIQYFDHQRWHEIASRRSLSRDYCVRLGVSLLNALPERTNVKES